VQANGRRKDTTGKIDHASIYVGRHGKGLQIMRDKTKEYVKVMVGF
jgi:hypothetical protein